MTDRELLIESLPFLLSALSRAHSWAEDCAEWVSTINDVQSKRLAEIASDMERYHAEVQAISDSLEG